MQHPPTEHDEENSETDEQHQDDWTHETLTMSRTTPGEHVGEFHDGEENAVEVYREGGNYVGRTVDEGEEYELVESKYHDDVFVAPADANDERVILTPADDDGYYRRSQPVPWIVRWLGGLE